MDSPLVDPALIGTSSEPVTFEVERGAIRKFADAIGDPNPVYQVGDIAPPTFPTTFRTRVPGVDLPAARILHGGEEFVYECPIRAGDRITCVRRVVDTYVKKGSSGTLNFLITEQEGRDPDGNLVYRCRSTVIVR